MKMNFPYLKTNKSTLTLMRGLSSVTKLNKNYYDTLKINQNATQDEIKSSYYNLSKLYHPDVNKDEGAKEKFRDITEAYEILGNYKIRRQYDRGMTARGFTNSKHNVQSSTSSSSASSSDEHEKTIKHMAFYKSRMKNYPKPVNPGHEKIYDFDAWTRGHYGDTLKQTVERKQMNSDIKEKRVIDNLKAVKDSNEISVIIGMMLLIIVASAMSMGKHNYDEPLETNSDDNQIE